MVAATAGIFLNSGLEGQGSLVYGISYGLQVIHAFTYIGMEKSHTAFKDFVGAFPTILG